jgi:hypothetical protein
MMLPKRQSGLEIVGNFWYLHEADLAKSFLESQGIRAWVLDEHQIRMRWHLAAALGGVKVAVSPSDAERSRELLAQDHSAALADIPEQSLPPAEDERCPRCHSPESSSTSHLQLATPVQWLQSLLFFLTLGLLVPRRRVRVQRHCAACGHGWSVIEHR